MSAVNVLVYPHRVLLLTDTKAVTEKGLKYHTVKTATFPWMRVAIAVRGHLGALRVFERLISQNSNSYDTALQFIVEHFADALAAEYLDASEAFAMRRDVELYVAGWGADGPAAAWVSSRQNDRQVQRISGCHICPVPDRGAQRRFAADVKAGMQQLMAEQAAQFEEVGGYIVATDIQENTILSYPGGWIG